MYFLFLKEVKKMDNTIKYFKILSTIPRESKNESAVADFLVDFANKHNLHVVRDKFNNVLIKKINESKQPIILQSHTDMVCVKEPDYNFDFSTMPLKLVEKDGYLSAYKTSLGADNGIGVAMILSLLEEDNNFNIEALFTTDEEVTMTGAINFDYSLLSSNKLISLDGFSSTQLINGCASICDSTINLKNNFINTNKKGYTLTVSGLKGGHSGADIDKQVGNAINIITEILLGFNNVQIVSFQGGKQFNFIPNFATVTFATTTSVLINEILTKYKNKYKDIEIKLTETSITKSLTNDNSKKLLNMLSQIKTGVICKDDNGIILSQNLASINLQEGIIKINIRAHNIAKEDEQILFLKSLVENGGATYKIFDRQCGLIPTKNSTLTNDLCKANKQANNEELKVYTKHISLEGAIFKQKKPDLDVAIVSPDIYDVHSTSERVYLPSIAKTYNLLQNYLNNFA